VRQERTIRVTSDGAAEDAYFNATQRIVCINGSSMQLATQLQIASGDTEDRNRGEDVEGSVVRSADRVSESVVLQRVRVLPVVKPKL